MKLDDYYSVKAAAKKAGIPYMALHQRIHRGVVPVIRLSENVVILHKDEVAKLAPARKRSTLPWNRQDPTRDRDHPLYPLYYRILKSCYLPRFREYKNHGEKGRKVSEVWLNSFDSFVRDVGPPPGPGFQLALKSDDRDYEPENCYWQLSPQETQ